MMETRLGEELGTLLGDLVYVLVGCAVPQTALILDVRPASEVDILLPLFHVRLPSARTLDELDRYDLELTCQS